MEPKSEEFQIIDYKVKYIQSREVDNSNQGRENLPDGYSYIKLKCKKCNHQWMATRGTKTGSLDYSPGSIQISCPANHCKNNGSIKTK